MSTNAPAAAPPVRRTVLTWGLISGGVGVGMMLLTLPFIDRHELAVADTLGYTSMLVLALLVFAAVRSYRRRAGGSLTFRRGLWVGALVALVAALCQVVAFQVVYFAAMPQFGERFVECMILRAQESGADAREIAETREQARTLRQLYDQPLTNALLVLGTHLPLGLAAALISAAVLRRPPGLSGR